MDTLEPQYTMREQIHPKGECIAMEATRPNTVRQIYIFIFDSL
jgi:hypothetical protein